MKRPWRQADTQENDDKAPSGRPITAPYEVKRNAEDKENEKKVSVGLSMEE